jgi:hypothetical protein
MDQGQRSKSLGSDQKPYDLEIRYIIDAYLRRKIKGGNLPL